MKRYILFMLFPLIIISCSSNVPPELEKGERFFNTFCANCHGLNAKGTGFAPTFLTKIYEPNQHPDTVFMSAPLTGVRAHHWNFGDMPRIDQIREEELREIILYIRWMQKEAGIF